MAILSARRPRAAVAVIAVAAATGVAGCYDPTIRDCALTCAGSGDCGDGQSCGDDHLCHGDGVACEATDGGTPARVDAPLALDAAHADAARPIDAMGPPPPVVVIHLTITGNGSVVVDGQQGCVAMEMGMSGKYSADCLVSVSANAVHSLVAMDGSTSGDGAQPSGNHFYMWSGGCGGSVPTCALTVQMMPVNVGAIFL